ncbi:xanthine dehydrogenase family protein molybdopterin-binding subunit [Candidatus Formimonas warabiya]|uniref:Aldehyde oxidase/xanthine dehydrogenase a/b hammerhead domain-containing protein n=1 Tax=Formimonas warabiya TaxID=1761012 RepID=A0A3G1KXG6_FORW1|nr:xanthine dehydrogenase family protein molybdopterin-binding subunit [Candidatus Formimonas warabiya]ATW27174.1 hypothetical protein DCMF_22645 [Candidatus Formimonas warabiya]
MSNDGLLIGRSVARPDALTKVRGEAVFCDDIYLPGMLYGVALRSECPHGVLKHIDVSDALGLPGVAVVATAKDIPGLNGFGRAVPDQPVIVSDRFRFIGDVIAMAAADTVEHGRAALRAVKTISEPFPVVTDPQEALEPDAPKIWPEGNLAAHLTVKKGDAESAFKDCDVIIENTYTTPMVDHAYLEVECAVADVDARKNTVIWASTQDPLPIVRNVAKVLGIEPQKVHVIQAVTGGGFGGKLDAGIDVAVRAALLSFLCGRPVKMVYSREESMMGSSKRHASIIRHKLGATKEGKLMAVNIDILYNKGAYASMGGASGGVPTKAIVHAAGPYIIPHAEIHLKNVYTNLPYGGAMRGYGVPQVSFAYECQMDELARALHMDPVHVREINLIKQGDETVTGQVLGSSVGSLKTLKKAEKVSEWRNPLAAEEKGLIRRGRGISFGYYGISTARFPDTGAALIFLTTDGRIRVATGITEIGQGVQSVFTQIAAEEISCPMDWIDIREVDTAVDPDSQSTSASRGTSVVGPAVQIAAQEAKRQLFSLAASVLEVDPAQIVVVPQGLAHWKTPQKLVSLKELAGYYAPAKDRIIGSGVWNKPRSTFRSGDGKGNPFYVYVFGAHVAEVEVNTRTGKIDLKKFTAVHDVGKALNVQQVEGQIRGGVSMGVGFALLEEITNRDGYLNHVNFDRYLIPTSRDLPQIEPVIVEENNPLGPYGAKGIGEPPAIPAAAAIANAVYDAVGVRCRDLPIIPERLLDEMTKKQKTRS